MKDIARNIRLLPNGELQLKVANRYIEVGHLEREQVLSVMDDMSNAHRELAKYHLSLADEYEKMKGKKV